MKKYFQNLIARKKSEITNLEKKFDKSEDAKEVREIGELLLKLKDEIADAEEQLKKLDNEQMDEERSLKTISSYNMNKKTEKRDDVLSSIEYRNAFAEYVRTGKDNEIFKRADIVVNGTSNTHPIGKIIPNTIMDEIVKNLKSYGNLYNRVRKLNVQGGVEFPIEELVPSVSWITETTTATAEAVPKFESSVSFGYHIAEARISQSLLSQVVSLPVLEREIGILLAEAFVKELESCIISGNGSGKPMGILNDTRISNDNKITMTTSNAQDWTKWREKLFAKIPLSYRAGGVLVMTVGTWEGLICTMRDTNNRPLYSETYDVNTGDTVYRFNGKEVILVESGLGLYDFDVATSTQPYMIYTKPENYAINSNLQIGFKRYFNEDTNKFVNKGLCICDGKLLDVNGTFIIKK